MGNVWVVCAVIVSVSGKLLIHNILSYFDNQHPLCYLLIFIYYASFFLTLYCNSSAMFPEAYKSEQGSCIKEA